MDKFEKFKNLLSERRDFSGIRVVVYAQKPSEARKYFENLEIKFEPHEKLPNYLRGALGAYRKKFFGKGTIEINFDELRRRAEELGLSPEEERLFVNLVVYHELLHSFGFDEFLAELGSYLIISRENEGFADKVAATKLVVGRFEGGDYRLSHGYAALAYFLNKEELGNGETDYVDFLKFGERAFKELRRNPEVREECELLFMRLSSYAAYLKPGDVENYRKIRERFEELLKEYPKIASYWKFKK